METLTKMWSNLVLRGGLAIAFGLALLAWPAMPVPRLLMVFGAFALIDGFATMKTGLSGAGDGQSWPALVLEGSVAMLLGAVTMMISSMGSHALLHVISAWFLWVGAAKLVVALRLRREVRGELLIVLAGLVGVVVGAALFFYPLQDVIESVRLVAAGCLVMGSLLAALAVRLQRRWRVTPAAT